MARPAIVALLLFASVPAAAQRSLPFTGYELALSGSTEVARGRATRLRGTAYRVRGLAELVHDAGGRLRARYLTDDAGPSSSWIGARADREGRFEVEIPIPLAQGEHPRLELELGEGDDARTFELPVSVVSPYDVQLRLDRRLYEADEPIHVWSLIRDARSGHPLAGQEVEIVLEGTPLATVRRAITTGPDGVASFDVALDPHAPEGSFSATLTIDEEVHTAEARVGTRTYERVFASVRATPETVPPHAEAIVAVSATTTSGAPIAGADVDLTVDGETHYLGHTEADGVAHIAIRAPAYLTHDTGLISLSALITHPAHGAARAFGVLHLAVPLTMQVEAATRLGGGLVPETDDVFYLVLSDGAGAPPAPGTEVEVEGAAVRGGRARVRTDDGGIAEVPARLPAGTWAPGDGDASTTSIVARIMGPLERTARLDLAVQPHAEIAPRADSPVVEPGRSIAVALLRSPIAARASVVVELLDGEDVIAVRWAAPGAARVSFDAPADRLGLFAIRARAIHETESVEGQGAIDRVIVRPPRPTFFEVRPERERYRVGERARVEIAGTPGEQGWAAVMVRDLAAHSGEEPFQRYWLERSFEREVLVPAPSAHGERVLRVALAAHGYAEAAPNESEPLLDRLGLPTEASEVSEQQPERGTLRDPWPLARELLRRGMGEPMLALEQMLAESIDNDALDEITSGRGAARRFRSDLLDGEETLGGGPLTVELLEAADPSFGYHSVGRRVARARLVRLLQALAAYLDPGDEASVQARMAAREPSDRWLPRMVERGLITAEELRDPWGGRFQLRRTPHPSVVLSVHATDLELASPGPDGRLGTGDDVHDPFARAVDAGTPWACASGEDELMRRLALISPVERTLEGIAEAYVRITAEMSEEEIGDAVHAGVSEGVYGLGLRGTGMGGGGTGTGSGYGSGAGSLGMGHIGTIGHGAGSGALSGLARVLRQRFPATLLFRPSVALDPSGRTPIEIQLADAVTTYVVETIVWRADGWIWSGRAEISADREIVVDAPVPEVARVGDDTIPLRVGNRGDRERALNVRVIGDERLGIESSAPVELSVGARDAAQVPYVLRPTHPGEGHLRVAVAEHDGTALDAVEHPIRVVTPTRRVRLTADALVSGDGEVRFEIPSEADGRAGSVEIAAGIALFGAPSDPMWSGWCRALGTPDPRPERGAPFEETTAARRVAAYWDYPSLDDQRIEVALQRLTRIFDAAMSVEGAPASRVRTLAQFLLDSAPIHARMQDRASLATQAQALLDRMRSAVADAAPQVSDDTEATLLAAAALGLTTDERDPRAAELVRRAERSIVSLGEERFVASEREPLRATVLLALADLRLGNRARAFELLRTLAHWASRGQPLSEEVRSLARVAVSLLTAGAAPESVIVTIDGARTELPARSRGGSHRIGGARPSGATRRPRADVGERARPGACGRDVRRALGAHRGARPVRARDRRGDRPPGRRRRARARRRNRTPRTIPIPVIEVDLPTGAEITEDARVAISRSSARPPDRSGDVLTITLAPQLPGMERRIPLRLRWSVGGTLTGLGVAASATDRPELVSILPPRELHLEQGAAE